MTKPVGALWRLAITAVVAVLLLILLANVITQPVEPEVRGMTAEFTDASGLYAGADVRVRGVRVGKIQSVDLQRRDGQSVASVAFTLEQGYSVDADTRLAIKYQSLTGSRYIDLVNAKEGVAQAKGFDHIPTSMTHPSFDITALFNGLQPVIQSLSPDEINKFASNAVDYLNGDGGGLAPMLESIRTLTRFVANRQQVISTLFRNLSTVGEQMSGYSDEMIQVLKWIDRPLQGAIDVTGEFRKTELFAYDFLTPVETLVTSLGIPAEGNNGNSYTTMGMQHATDTNVSNIDEAMDRAFHNFDDFIDAFKLIPVMWENIGPSAQAGDPAPCSRGNFQLPEQMDVLLNGQRVVLCNR